MDFSLFAKQNYADLRPRFQSLLKRLLWNEDVEWVKVLNALGPLCPWQLKGFSIWNQWQNLRVGLDFKWKSFKDSGPTWSPIQFYHWTVSIWNLMKLNKVFKIFFPDYQVSELNLFKELLISIILVVFWQIRLFELMSFNKIKQTICGLSLTLNFF